MCVAEEICYDLIKLLLTSNTLAPLEALLSERLLTWGYKYVVEFGCHSALIRFPGNMTLAHLVCAVNPACCSQLLNSCVPENGSWTIKDNEGNEQQNCMTKFARVIKYFIMIN